MSKVIIYKSKTGHTERYAKMLSEELNIPCYSYKDVKINDNDEVIFLSYIYASKIMGLSKILKKYKVKVVIAVGALAHSKDYLNTLKQANNIDTPIFYLRGGINYSKLNFFFKKFLPIIGKDIAKDDKELLSLFKNGGDFVSKDNLKDIFDFFNKKYYNIDNFSKGV